MTEQQWEFCSLIWDETQDHLAIRYFAGGKGYVLLSEAAKKARNYYNPFNKVMSLLGSFGWELVSVQHAHSYHAGEKPIDEEKPRLLEDNCIAYFKRPIKRGREIDEPKIILD